MSSSCQNCIVQWWYAKKGYVYNVGSQKPVLYTGVTSELEGRTWELKHSVFLGFTSKYHTFKLLYYKEFDSIEEAIYREKQIEHWKRAWKLEQIRSKNPLFKDLYEDLYE